MLLYSLGTRRERESQEEAASVLLSPSKSHATFSLASQYVFNVLLVTGDYGENDRSYGALVVSAGAAANEHLLFRCMTKNEYE